MESCGADQDAFSDADERFHLALANATGNPLMTFLYKHINDVRGHAQWRESRHKILTPENIDRYNRQHRAIFEAIRRRDVDAAVNGIGEHVRTAQIDLLGTDALAIR